MNTSPLSTNRTVLKSFRVDAKAFRVLQGEAKRRDVTPSALVNQFIVAYAEYGRFVDQLNALSLRRKTLSEILNAIQDEPLIGAAERAGRSAPAAFVRAMRGRVTLPAIRELMTILSKYANLFEINEIKEDDSLHLVLVHGLGRKWSLFLAHYLRRVFALANVPVQFDVSDKSVVLSLAT